MPAKLLRALEHRSSRDGLLREPVGRLDLLVCATYIVGPPLIQRMTRATATMTCSVAPKRCLPCYCKQGVSDKHEVYFTFVKINVCLLPLLVLKEQNSWKEVRCLNGLVRLR